MSYRQSSSSNKGGYLLSQSRLKQQNKCDSTYEGCPVIEESGTVCGETKSLNIFQEFRQIYDDCLQKLEGTVSGNSTLKKLAPFKKLIDDLWEQNTMLVETVEELEQEATYRVTNLQERLNKSCQKICDYKDDIECLVKIIQSFCENGVFDLTGLKFKTFCCASVFGNCDDSCSVLSKNKESQADVSFKNNTGYAPSASQITYGVQQENTGVKCGYLGNYPSAKTISSKLSTRVNNKNSSNACYFDSISSSRTLIRNSDQSSKCEIESVNDTLCEESMPLARVSFKNEKNADNVDCSCTCSCTMDPYDETDDC